MANQQWEIYQGYLKNWEEKHKNMVKPVMLDRKEAGEYWQGEVISHVCKVFEDFGHVYKMPDGKIVEAVGKFGFTHVYVFETEKDWHNYDKPMPMSIYLGW